MKILFDNNVPIYLLRVFDGHDVTTAYRQGWARLVNGELLRAAEEAGYQLFITLDKNLPFQQNLKSRQICVAVLYPEGSEESDMVVVGLKLLRQLDSVAQGNVLVILGKEKAQ